MGLLSFYIFADNSLPRPFPRMHVQRATLLDKVMCPSPGPRAGLLPACYKMVESPHSMFLSWDVTYCMCRHPLGSSTTILGDLRLKGN